jgi:hypothetical protein
MYERLGVPLSMTWEVYGDDRAGTGRRLQKLHGLLPALILPDQNAIALLHSCSQNVTAYRTPLALAWRAVFEDCFRMFNPLTWQAYNATVESWTAAVFTLLTLLPQHPQLQAELHLTAGNADSETAGSAASRAVAGDSSTGNGDAAAFGRRGGAGAASGQQAEQQQQQDPQGGAVSVGDETGLADQTGSSDGGSSSSAGKALEIAEALKEHLQQQESSTQQQARQQGGGEAGAAHGQLDAARSQRGGALSLLYWLLVLLLGEWWCLRLTSRGAISSFPSAAVLAPHALPNPIAILLQAVPLPVSFGANRACAISSASGWVAAGDVLAASSRSDTMLDHLVFESFSISQTALSALIYLRKLTVPAFNLLSSPWQCAPCPTGGHHSWDAGGRWPGGTALLWLAHTLCGWQSNRSYSCRSPIEASSACFSGSTTCFVCSPGWLLLFTLNWRYHVWTHEAWCRDCTARRCLCGRQVFALCVWSPNRGCLPLIVAH